MRKFRFVAYKIEDFSDETEGGQDQSLVFEMELDDEEEETILKAKALLLEKYPGTSIDEYITDVAVI